MMSESGDVINELIGQTESLFLEDLEPILQEFEESEKSDLQESFDDPRETKPVKKRQSKEAEDQPSEALERPRRAYSYTEDRLRDPCEKVFESAESPNKPHIQQLIKHYEALNERPKLEEYENKQMSNLYQFHQSLTESISSELDELESKVSKADEPLERPRRMYSFTESDLTSPREVLAEDTDSSKSFIKHYVALDEQPKFEEYKDKQVLLLESPKFPTLPTEESAPSASEGKELKNADKLERQARTAAEKVVFNSEQHSTQKRTQAPRLVGPNIANIANKQ